MIKTGSKRLCLFLALLLVVSLLAIPAAAVDHTAYADTVKKAISAGDKDAPGCGLLSDLNGDGTDELLLLCRKDGVVKLNVYTISGTKVSALLTDRTVFTETGGDTGEVSIVERDGKTMLLVSAESPEPLGPTETGERVRTTGSAELYAMTDGRLQSASQVEYTITRVGEDPVASEDFTCTETTADDTKALSEKELEAWFDGLDRQARLSALAQDEKNDGLPLELLLGRLQGRIGVFQDVPANAWFSDSVEWALLHGVTDGTTETTFSPDVICTRAHMVTFLWRSHGSPKVSGTPTMPFTDVPKTEYYYDAVLWAITLGITDGVTDTTFAPDATLTRGQTVTFLWRDACQPSAAVAHFADVPKDAYFADAVGWAQEIGVTDGMTETTFAPDGSCTRAQIVTFISRAACAPGVHAQNVTGLKLDRTPDYATDEAGRQILFSFVGDAEDFAVTSIMLTAKEGMRPDAVVYGVGPMHDGDTFLLCTDVPDVAAHYGVTYTIGDRTVTWAITCSGENGSVILVEL